jgi:hypothetical protein
MGKNDFDPSPILGRLVKKNLARQNVNGAGTPWLFLEHGMGDRKEIGWLAPLINR